MSSATTKSAAQAPVVVVSGGVGIKSALGMIATTICTVLAAGVVLGALGSMLGFYRADTVLSGSMRPSYPEGSVVLATRQDSRKLAVGQVIIFSAPPPYGEVVTHRVQTVTLDKKTGQPLITTKGDNNPTADPWKALVPVDQVWVVKGHIPLLGWVANWSVKWWPLLLGVMVAGRMATFARKRIRGKVEGTDPEPVDPETDSAADPAPQALPRSALSRSLSLLLLLPIAGVIGGAYLAAASGRGDAITESARTYATDQARNVNGSTSARGGAAPTASPPGSTPPAAARPTNPAPAPTTFVAQGKEILAPGVVRLEPKGGAVGEITIVANAQQEVSERTVDVVNASTMTIQAIRISATTRKSTDRRLTIRVCATKWMNLGGQAACPGSKYSVLSQSQVPTSSILIPRQPLEPNQSLHLLLELRSAFGTPLPGPRADVTLRLDGGHSP